jgi:hypothetical protein
MLSTIKFCFGLILFFATNLAFGQEPTPEATAAVQLQNSVTNQQTAQAIQPQIQATQSEVQTTQPQAQMIQPEQRPVQPQQQATQPQQQPSQTGPTPTLCPTENSLERDTNMKWHVGNVWKSFTQSFATEIGSFIGAQWVGINVGKIICLYQGKDSFEFPIALEQKESTLFFEPTSSNWSAKINGYRICKSTNINDCPFFIQKAEATPEDPYEQLKYNPQPEQTY